MGKPANFEIVPQGDDVTVLVIRDLGPWDVHLTISNDAEWVVTWLHDGGLLAGVKTLLYYDSEGKIDELRFSKGGIFQGFAPGPDRRP